MRSVYPLTAHNSQLMAHCYKTKNPPSQRDGGLPWYHPISPLPHGGGLIKYGSVCSDTPASDNGGCFRSGLLGAHPFDLTTQGPSSADVCRRLAATRLSVV